MHTYNRNDTLLYHRVSFLRSELRSFLNVNIFVASLRQKQEILIFSEIQNSSDCEFLWRVEGLIFKWSNCAYNCSAHPHRGLKNDHVVSVIGGWGGRGPLQVGSRTITINLHRWSVNHENIRVKPWTPQKCSLTRSKKCNHSNRLNMAKIRLNSFCITLCCDMLCEGGSLRLLSFYHSKMYSTNCRWHVLVMTRLKILEREKYTQDEELIEKRQISFRRSSLGNK